MIENSNHIETHKMKIILPPPNGIVFNIIVHVSLIFILYTHSNVIIIISAIMLCFVLSPNKMF